MNIVVASGKGGTGKSMVSANLAYSLSHDYEVVLVDCDVEEPNDHLFFSSDAQEEEDVLVLVPDFDYEKCNFCGDCGKFCKFGAITVLKDRIMFDPKLCHSCGGCVLCCHEDAISEKPRPTGRTIVSQPYPKMTLITGILNEGEVACPPVIDAAKKKAVGHPLVIDDAPPGIACPVIETLQDADVCILVTESTPFGLHDLRLAAGVVSEFKIPAGVVINKSDGMDEETRSFCEQEGLPVLLTIPFERETARIQSSGELLARVKPEWKETFLKLYKDASSLAGGQ